MTKLRNKENVQPLTPFKEQDSNEKPCCVTAQLTYSSLHYGKKLCLGLQGAGAGDGTLNNEINYLVSRQQYTQNGGNT